MPQRAPITRPRAHRQPLARVAQVMPGSPAQAAGMRPGDALRWVNSTVPQDYLDYRFLAAEDQVQLGWVTPQGRVRTARLEKHPDQDLGLVFSSVLFDGMRTCANRCPFCFVHQLPPGLRPSLYVRDDDYRLSFLCGNYVTLTNCSPADLERVVRLRLSPLYVSVHAADPALRARMLGRRQVPDLLGQLRDLAAAGIRVHAQVVLCPGMNDGQVLADTVERLAALYPGVASLVVVPVGLTAHREGLPGIRGVAPAQARATVRWVHARQRELLARLDSRFVYLSDEFYLLAGRPFPPAPAYEGFPQLENGVGMSRRFLNETGRLCPRPGWQPRYRSLTLVTGLAARPLAAALAARLGELGVAAEVFAVENSLFGPPVTVAGLLPGRDLLAALRTQPLGEAVAIPDSCLAEGRFLDDVELAAVAGAAGRPLLAAAGPRQLWRALCGREEVTRA